MGDMGDTFRAMREDSKQRKEHNVKQSLKLLDEATVPWNCLSVVSKHYRIAGCIDYWPSTGLWKVMHTSIQGRGVKHLIAYYNNYIRKGEINANG